MMPTSARQTELAIDLYLDFCCPWCLIGMRRIRQALALIGGEIDVAVNVRPFLLQPEAPDGGVNVHQRLREKHGVRPEDVFPRIESEARDAGIALDLMRQPTAYASNRAHALVWAARGKGTALDLAEGILAAYFLELVPIDQPEMLAEIGSKHGFTESEARAACEDPQLLATVRREARSTIDLGVRSVPTMVIDRGHALSASSPPDRLAAAIRRSATQSRAASETPDRQRRTGARHGGR